MGIFDKLKNTWQIRLKQCFKGRFGAVNNAMMHKSKTFVFADYPKMQMNSKNAGAWLSSPLSTAAFGACVAWIWWKSGKHNRNANVLKIISGDERDGCSVFARQNQGQGIYSSLISEGSSVKNDYTPNVPYKITVSEYAYTSIRASGYARFRFSRRSRPTSSSDWASQKGQITVLMAHLHSGYTNWLGWSLAWRRDFCKNQKKQSVFLSVVLCFHAVDNTSYDSR